MVIMKELIHTENFNFNYSIPIFVKQIPVLYKCGPISGFLYVHFFLLSSTTPLPELTMKTYYGMSDKTQKLLILH
jgi:hypothetical protein